MAVAAYQNAVREQKLAAEISAAKRERDFYMGQVDKAKGIEAMKERKRKVSFGLATIFVSICGWVCKALLPFRIVHVHLGISVLVLLADRTLCCMLHVDH